MTFDWDEHADGWDDDPEVRIYAASANEYLTRSVDLAGLRVLDFGCGTGLLTEKMARNAGHVVALDSSSKMIDVLAEKSLPNVTPVKGVLSANLIARDPAFKSQFDLVTAASVCAFVSDYAQTLTQLRTVLVPGGRFVQWDWLAKAPDFGFTEADIRDALSGAGFSDISVTQPFSITMSDEGPMPVLMAVATNQ